MVFLMISGAIGVVASIYVIRAQLTVLVGDTTAQSVVSIVNAIQIYVFNYLYGRAAERLTVEENYRTDTEYEDSMIAKFFVFQVIVNCTIHFVSSKIYHPLSPCSVY